MKAGAWIGRHRRSILFLLALLAAAGAFSVWTQPVSLFPAVDFPRVAITLDAGDRPAKQMEILVTRPVEEAVRRVPGVRTLRSTTSRGSAEVSVTFDWGTDMAVATLQVNAALGQAAPDLPPGTRFLVRRMDPTVFPIIAYSLTSPTLSPTALHDLAQYQLRPLLSAVPGVARVQASGGAIEEYRVDVSPAKLKSYGLSLGDVAKAVGAENVITAVGKLEDHYKLYLLVSDTRFSSAAGIRDAVIRAGPTGVVRVADVATVQDSTMPQWIRVTANGRDAVLLSIYQQPGSNSVQIAKDVKAKLASAGSVLPAGVELANWYDQSELVLGSAGSVRDAILIGVGLAAAVLFVFLGSWKTTLIAIITVPAVLAVTVLVLHVLGMSFNIMTLGGMAAAVGLIIDDAIVMTEHIVRRLRGGEGAARDTPIHHRVLRATDEFVQPLAGSSAATVIIFAPLALLTGVTGAFFKALSITMAAGLVVSYFVAWLALPVLAQRLLKERDAAERPPGRFWSALLRGYDRTLAQLLARPWLLLLGLTPLAVLGWLGYQHTGTGFMPHMDEGGFVVDYRSAPGTALSETDRLLRQVEAIIRSLPDIQTYSRRTGISLGDTFTEPNQGDFFIRLKSGNRRPVDEVMDDLRGRIEHQVPGLEIEMAQLMEDVIGDLTAVPQPIEIKIFSDNPRQLHALARKTAQLISRIPGVVDVKSGVNPAGDSLEIHVDRARAALEGVDPDAVTRELSDYLQGNVATQIPTDVKAIGVRVWVPPDVRNFESDLASLSLRAPDGHYFPLSRVATIETLTGEPEISREDLKPMDAVTARISGRDLGSVIADVKKTMANEGKLPPGVYYDLGGLYAQQQIAFHGLMIVFAAATALVFVLLLFLYESFRIAVSIILTSLLSASAVFIGLWLTGIELNITAIMGMTMIIGIATEVAIFYFSEQRVLRGESGELHESLREAGKSRMRPIAMTTIAAILTLLPLAFALGRGSQMQQPLAIAIISGLVVQLPLVLLAMPAIYALLFRIAGWRRR